MREGPLADLFRQTDGSQENVEQTPAESAAAAEAAAAAEVLPVEAQITAWAPSEKELPARKSFV